MTRMPAWQDPIDVSPARRNLMLAVLLTATFMAQFDFFVVNVAVPTFTSQLHAGPQLLELIVGGYAFAYASGMITGGRLGDLYGHRRVYVAGMVSFTLASLFCGVAPNAATLIVARLLQGLSGALMVPQVLAVITSTFPPATRTRAVAWYSVAAGVGSIAGQALGGLLIQANLFGLGWRAIFLVNVPVGAASAVLAWWLLPRTRPVRQAKLDPVGAVGVAAALALLLIPLALGRSAGWPAWTWASIAASVPVAALTLRWQRMLTARGQQPIVDLTLFRLRSYVAGLLAGAAFMAYFGSYMFTLTLLLQEGMGLSPLRAGLTFAPQGVTFSIAALLSVGIVRRYGPRAIVVSTALIAVGLALLAIQMYISPGRIRLAGVVCTLGFLGLPNGVVLPQLIGTALRQVAPQQAGIGSGTLVTSQQFASSIGVTVVGTVFFSVLGASASATSYSRAMEWATWINVALVLAVIALISYCIRVTVAESAMTSANHGSGTDRPSAPRAVS